jgi:ATP-dependent RNA helicase SUPV3L1/SUV3
MDGAAEDAPAPADEPAVTAGTSPEDATTAEPPALEGEAVPIAADATAEPTPPETEAASPTTPAAEPVMIEIWRPAGRRDRDRPPQHRRPARRHEAPAAAQAATPAGDAPSQVPETAGADPQRPERPERTRRRGKRGSGRPTDGPRPEGAAAGEKRERHGGPRRDGHDRPRRDGKDRDRREQRGGAGMRFSTEPPKGEARQADPNSPFAALAALKAELEAKERGG